MTETRFLDIYQMERMREQLLILRLPENHLPTTIDMVVTGQIEDMEAITID